MKYHACVLLNTATGRFHPILFRMAPLPGGSNVPRWKSIGHHTDGFDTIEQAIAYIKDNEDCRMFGIIYLWDGKDVPWDGKDVPAMVSFFPYSEESDPSPDNTEKELIAGAATAKEALAKSRDGDGSFDLAYL
jgi:hypothetical protein